MELVREPASEAADVAAGSGPARTFRFGTGCYRPRSRQEYLDDVHRLEDQGYAILLTPDHFEPQLAPIPALMAAAMATTDLRVGTYVCANDFRHPAVLAKEAATLDVLSDGRFELGLGAGYLSGDYTSTGTAFDPPHVRIARLEEAVHVIKGLLHGDRVDLAGTHYTVAGLDGTPQPVQRPHPPLLLAGGGQRMLSLAAREADIVGLLQPTRSGAVDIQDDSRTTTAQQVAWIREAAGDRFAELELNTLLLGVVVTDDRQEAANRLAADLGITPTQLLDSIHWLVGSVDELVEEVEGWRADYGISYVSVLEEYRDAFAPVVARLAGR